MSAWTLYWISRLDGLCGFLEVATVLSGLSFIAVALIVCALHFIDNDPITKARAWAAACLCVLFMSISTAKVLVPTTKEAAAILAIPIVLNNEQMQDETKELYELAKSWLETKVKDEDDNE